MPRNHNPAESHGIADQLHDTAVGLGETIHDVAAGARDMASEKFKKSRDAAVRWEHNVEAHIAEKPLQSLMIAAGVGFILGMLWKRR
jgi:ElaB/YqjD/DUF883 family membrane-anchored ribosome-binding protein